MSGKNLSTPVIWMEGSDSGLRWVVTQKLREQEIIIYQKHRRSPSSVFSSEVPAVIDAELVLPVGTRTTVRGVWRRKGLGF